MKIEMYTDGACSGNPGPGGCAAVLVDSQTHEEKTSIINGYRHTTNNRMEIKAVVHGLGLAGNLKDIEEIEVFSDSQLVVNTMNLGWARKSNTDLWEEMDAELSLLKTKGVRIRFTKVKGHAGNPFNEMADRLAVLALEAKDKHSIDSVYEAESGYKPDTSKKKAFLVTFEVTTRVVLDNIEADPDTDDETYERIVEEAIYRANFDDIYDNVSKVEEDPLTDEEKESAELPW